MYEREKSRSAKKSAKNLGARKKSAKNQGARERESANAKARNLRPNKERESASAKSSAKERESASAKRKKKRVPSSVINTDSREHLHSNDRGEILVLKTTTAKAFAKNVFIHQE